MIMQNHCAGDNVGNLRSHGPTGTRHFERGRSRPFHWSSPAGIIAQRQENEATR